MTLIPQFPGMNPYLESPYRWPEIHTWLIVELARTLNPQLKPKYRAAVETRIYTDSVLVGIADAAVFEKPNISPKRMISVAIATKPERVTVPMMSEVTERYLEIRERETQRVLTVIEVLSPANKRAGQGRKKYLEKRQNIFDSSTHLVEIDLLRKGEPMPLCEEQTAAYQILVSRARDRPIADRYAFNLQEPIPKFPIPLDGKDIESVIDLKELLNRISQDSGIEESIDYSVQPQPELSAADLDWVRSLSANSY